jgi:hypothetical protein
VLVFIRTVCRIINRSPRIAVVSTDQLCFPEQSGRVDRSSRPSARRRRSKRVGAVGSNRQSAWGRWGSVSCLVCDFLARRVAFRNAQLSSGTDEELRSETHKGPAVLAHKGPLVRTNHTQRCGRGDSDSPTRSREEHRRYSTQPRHVRN